MLVDVKVAAAGGRRRRVGFYSAIRREVPIRTFNDWGGTRKRERREAKTTTRRAFELLPDIRTEILIGGRQERLLDLMLLERVARGLDPGERHLIADKFSELPDRRRGGGRADAGQGTDRGRRSRRSSSATGRSGR